MTVQSHTTTTWRYDPRTVAVRVFEVAGDLFERDVDCLVNPWNRNFMPRWLLVPAGVSAQLKRRTGSAPWKELHRLGVLKEGQAAITGAGRMGGHLIHVAGLNAWWRATPHGVEAAARNAVLAAAEIGASSLAMPLIGSGTGGLSEHDSRSAIQKGLGVFAEPGSGVDAVIDVEIVARPN